MIADRSRSANPVRSTASLKSLALFERLRDGECGNYWPSNNIMRMTLSLMALKSVATTTLRRERCIPLRLAVQILPASSSCWTSRFRWKSRSADRIAGEAHPRLNIPVREVEVIRGRGSAWAALLSLATRAEVSASLGDDDTADRIAAMLAGLALLAVDPVEFLEAASLAGGIHIV